MTSKTVTDSGTRNPATPQTPQPKNRKSNKGGKSNQSSQQSSVKKGTLDQLHIYQLEQIGILNDSIPAKTQQIRDLQRTHDMCQLKYRKTRDPNMLKTIQDASNKIFYLTRELESVRSRDRALEYTQKALPVLIDYYDNPDLPSQSDSVFLDTNHDPDAPQNLLNYNLFAPIKKKEIKQTGKFLTKTKLYQNYISAIEPGYSVNAGESACLNPQCDGLRVLGKNEEFYECDECGITDCIPCVVEKNGYADRHQDSNRCAYKRSSHLAEVMNQIQGRETTDIPVHIFSDVQAELNRRGDDTSTLTIPKLRKILRRLHHHRYYDHVTHIHQKITGIQPLTFERESEVAIFKMFDAIQAPFNKCCPPDRTNFPTYSYILRKFCELLDLPEHVELFPKLKNNTKLIEHDRIWKAICNEINWKFIKSI